jgi:hypothetical protein
VAYTIPLPPCDNWWDDDQDGLTDYPADPECATGWDIRSSSSPAPSAALATNWALVMPLLWWLYERRRRRVLSIARNRRNLDASPVDQKGGSRSVAPPDS